MLPQVNPRFIQEIKSNILRLQGIKSCGNGLLDAKLGPMAASFPNASFPLGAVHEFLTTREDASSVSGFIAGLLSTLMARGDVTVWISSTPGIFPPALKFFGLNPGNFIFIKTKNEKEILWAMEEALKCGALKAVIADVKEMSFTASRRLQLAVEQSQVTGFVIRDSRYLQTTSCLSRWKVTSLPGELIDKLPGVGSPRWKVELLRIKNGKPGTWDACWDGDQLQVRSLQREAIHAQSGYLHKKAG